MANFKPPANGASQGNFFQAKIPKMAVFEANRNCGSIQTCKLYLAERLAFRLSAQAIPAPCQEKQIFGTTLFDKDIQKKFQPILVRQSWDNWRYRQTDRQTERQILWHHLRVCVDFFFKLNLLPPYSLCSQGITDLFGVSNGQSPPIVLSSNDLSVHMTWFKLF